MFSTGRHLGYTVKMNPESLLFLDTETTGLEHGRLIQIAFKRRGNATTFVEYYKAPVPIEFEAMGVHHITEAMVADKVPFAETETFKTLPATLASSILVAHNAAYDVSILKTEGIETPLHICTYKVAYRLYDLPNHKLQTLRYRWGIEVPNAVAHDAAGDVDVLEKVFDYILADYIKNHGVSESDAIKEFVRITQEPALLRRLSFGKNRGMTFDEILEKDPEYLRWLSTLADKDDDFKHTVRHYLNKLNA